MRKDEGRDVAFSKAVELIRVYSLGDLACLPSLVFALWDCCLPPTAPLALALQGKGIAVLDENSDAREWIMSATDARVKTLCKQAQKKTKENTL